MTIESVYIVDDDPFIREFAGEALSRAGYAAKTFAAAREALAALSEEPCDLLLTDLVMPDVDGLELLRSVKKLAPDTVVVIMTAFGTVESAVEAIRAGAHDYLLKPFGQDQLTVALAKAEEQRRLIAENDFLRAELDSHDAPAVVTGRDPAMQRVYDSVARVARTRATVLIHGETGTGKEVVARLIHQNSPRAAHPMIKVNCAALSENLLESELFGHEKGAFTGALARKLGRFELAHGGTLLLDEISEIPVGLQAKLLRVLELEEFDRVGGTRTLRVDVRIITTTNRNLHEEIRRGAFRQDLFFRLNVVPIQIPPLRERASDVPALAEAFLAEFSRETGEQRRIEPAGLRLLAAYHWPGNVRELRNLIHRLVVMEPAAAITAAHIRRELVSRQGPEAAAASAAVGARLDAVERDHILRTLEHTAGNKEAASRILGISSRTLRNKLAAWQQAWPRA